MSEKISVVMITKNEEKNIEKCIQSLLWADEIIVLDTGSTDQTIQLLEKYPVKITIQKEWKGFGLAKQEAVNLANHDWILSIDADEIITEKLQGIIREKAGQNPLIKGFRIKRNSFYCGQEIKHFGWDKDYTLRLFHKSYGHYNEKIVHEYVVLSTEAGRINEPILHYTYPEISIHIQKMISYAKLGAEQDFAKGRKTNIFSAIFATFHYFVKMYVLKRGFLDGRIGLILVLNSCFGVFLKYIYIWELCRNQSKKK